jgi:putative cardiolipin synthase
MSLHLPLHHARHGPATPQKPVTAGAGAATSVLDGMVGGMLERAGSTTGVALVPQGLEAFTLRAAMARVAGRSLDLQYYRWSDDVTGRLLAREVLMAADRGVRVRLLLDDSYALGADRRMTLLSAHPRIELRLFNASRVRWLGQIGMAVEFVLGGWHLNHRMHNKNWVADGRLALVGGRNVADAYFDGAGDFNFRDMDLLIAGQASSQAQSVFDSYWASSLTIPVERFRGHGGDAPALAEFRAALDAEPAPDLPYAEALVRADHALEAQPVLPAEGTVRVLSDPPAKAKGRGVPGGMAPAINAALQSAEREAVLISPYFVPGRGGMALLADMVRRGVKVTVITNSLAATDVVAVHAGYARYRPQLLELGVELFELKRSGPHGSGVFGSKGASLHTKALVIDDSLVFVGSFNLDPRSANLNTEMGAFAQHPGLAAQMQVECQRLSDPRRSYRLRRGPGEGLLWEDAEGTTGREPEASWMRRSLARAVRWLPVEAQL